MPVTQVERISTEDAYMFPVIASVGLFSLFLAFTFFKEYVTVILTCYALALGTGSTASMLRPLVAFLMPKWASASTMTITMPAVAFQWQTGEQTPDSPATKSDVGDKASSSVKDPPSTELGAFGTPMGNHFPVKRRPLHL